MVAESSLRLATNIIFTTVFVSLLSVNYRLLQLRLRHFISLTKVRYWRISVFQREFWWSMY